MGVNTISLKARIVEETTNATQIFKSNKALGSIDLICSGNAKNTSLIIPSFLILREKVKSESPISMNSLMNFILVNVEEVQVITVSDLSQLIFRR